MWTTVLAKLGLIVFRLLPIERIVAMLLQRVVDYLIAKKGANTAAASAKLAEYMAKATTTIAHINEQVELLSDVLQDQKISAEEVGLMRAHAANLRLALLDLWAKGEPAKATQQSLGQMGIEAAYAEPLLRTNGCARVSVLLAVAVLGIGLLAGCGTATRCQTMTFEGCYIVVNEPSNLENPSYPRSMQIGVQDQMIEGGTDSIASGNPATPTVTIPLGDSGIGALAGALGSLLPAKEAAPSNAAAPAAPQ